MAPESIGIFQPKIENLNLRFDVNGRVVDWCNEFRPELKAKWIAWFIEYELGDRKKSEVEVLLNELSRRYENLLGRFTRQVS